MDIYNNCIFKKLSKFGPDPWFFYLWTIFFVFLTTENSFLGTVILYKYLSWIWIRIK